MSGFTSPIYIDRSTHVWSILQLQIAIPSESLAVDVGFLLDMGLVKASLYYNKIQSLIDWVLYRMIGMR